MSYDNTETPKGLNPSGSPPTTRMSNAGATRDRVWQLRAADEGRSKRRAMVKGLVDGNPPYKAGDLRRAGRADACNVNWRTAEFYLNTAVGAFYDIFSESPTFTTVHLEGDEPQVPEWSHIATEEFQRLQVEDESWDYSVQQSQHDMVLYGNGPLLFPDEYDWRPMAIKCKDLLVPEHAKSDVNTWDEMAILSTYLTHQLYDYIRNESQASAMGWNVSLVKKAIVKAHPRSQEGGVYQGWEWHQQQLKNQCMSHSADSNVVEVAHYYVREFDGGITHVIVTSPNSSADIGDYLYKKVERYDKWRHVIHPMYYDNLGGGEHHSVTGMGVKMFAALEFENRLLCNLGDKTFAPKTMFKPTTPQAEQAFALVRMGDAARLPAGWDMFQTPVAGMIEEGLAMHRTITQQITANLSSYRQNLMKTEGNPITATEVSLRAGEQARLGKTQLARYYTQKDWLYAEKYRRAVNCKMKSWPGGESAMAFQKRCRDRGVPLSALKKIRRVEATRIVGQGSEFMRQQALEFLLGLAGMLPTSGRDSLIRDVIAARAGQVMVNRYFPTQEKDTKREDQLAFAMVQIGSMKDGVPAIVTDTQDHELFAGTFLQAASEAMQSLQQGANPAEVLKFIDQVGPATATHIQKLAEDPSRKEVAKGLMKSWQQLAKLADQLRERMAQQAAQAQEQAAQQNQVMNDEALKAWQVQREQERLDAEFVAEQRRKDLESVSRMAVEGNGRVKAPTG